jgi:chromosomal replication initiation ATPase DnaA
MSPYVMPGLKSRVTKLKRKVQADDIETEVLQYFKLTPEIIRTKDRNHKIVTTRYIICYLLRKHTSMTLVEIVQYLSPAISDHSTVVHGVRFITGQLSSKTDNEIKDIFNEIYI